MFRIGGTAEGITSGLSRQGYATNEDNLVKKNDFSKMKAKDLGDMTFDKLAFVLKNLDSNLKFNHFCSFLKRKKIKYEKQIW